MVLLNKNKNYDKFKEKLQDAIETERIITQCCKHLGTLIKNGKIRKQFFVMSETAAKDEALLRKLLEQQGLAGYIAQERCKFCRINPESFSLSGALNLGLEVTAAAINYYRDLVNFSADSDEKKLYQRLLGEKNEQRNFLKKEQKFALQAEEKNQLDCIGNYCIPKVISKL